MITRSIHNENGDANFLVMEPSSLFPAQIRQIQATISTDFLFVSYDNESMFQQQLDNLAQIPLNYVETCTNIAQT